MNELGQVYSLSDRESVKSMVVPKGSSDKESEAACNVIISKLDKNYKVILNTQERSKHEQYILGSVCSLL